MYLERGGIPFMTAISLFFVRTFHTISSAPPPHTPFTLIDPLPGCRTITLTDRICHGTYMYATNTITLHLLLLLKLQLLMMMSIMMMMMMMMMMLSMMIMMAVMVFLRFRHLVVVDFFADISLHVVT